MLWWHEIIAKGVVIFVALFALLGTAALGLVAALGNGSAIGSDEFSWAYAMVTLALVASQGTMIIIGCATSMRWIESNSERLQGDG